jgi:hypothetical protein
MSTVPVPIIEECNIFGFQIWTQTQIKIVPIPNTDWYKGYNKKNDKLYRYPVIINHVSQDCDSTWESEQEYVRCKFAYYRYTIWKIIRYCYDECSLLVAVRQLASPTLLLSLLCLSFLIQVIQPLSAHDYLLSTPPCTLLLNLGTVFRIRQTR